MSCITKILWCCNADKNYKFVFFLSFPKISETPRGRITQAACHVSLKLCKMLIICQVWSNWDCHPLPSNTFVYFLTLSCPIGTFMDFPLSNIRPFYLSMGNPLGRKGLIHKWTSKELPSHSSTAPENLWGQSLIFLLTKIRYIIHYVWHLPK